VSRTLKAHLLLVMVTLIWGATFVVIKEAIKDISPMLFNAVRMTLATACLLVIYWRKVMQIDLKVFIAGVQVGIFLWLGYEFQTKGLISTTPSRSGFITGVSVVLVPLLMALFWKRKVRAWTAAGVVCAFIGMYFMMVPAGGDTFSSINYGDVLTFGCAISFALQIIFCGEATRHHPFELISFLQTATAMVLMWISVPSLEHPHVTWTKGVIAGILITGVLGTAVAFTVQAWAQQFTPSTHTALIFSLEPVCAWITSAVVLHERLGMRGGAGAALILTGVLVSELLGASQPVAVAESA